ncbi:hypothetical protein SynBIOSE41_00139 [Synechococcus sp. BIOS-E4-1]|uniref:sulfotransferase n=1 Tax=Synechococcus sp. BIOS-E4-1 TaxID=1400864 RepID=UPI001649764A|nr:sulfotransferase [Synechococcus sp. BIOS-E4-1]QNI52718.1 hypothetical protein SynBIOSE41_00139 [Synechococcus sp. BIOS-E4-1]
MLEDNLTRQEYLDSNPLNTNSGKGRIFIVGMPRSSSTLLETILSTNPAIKNLGESRSLEKAIVNIEQLPEPESSRQKLNDLGSKLEPIDNIQLHTQ